MIPAITYFRTGRHYHRPQELNCRVRNGNECDILGKVTGKLRMRYELIVLRRRAGALHPQVYKNGSGRVYLKTHKLLKT